MDFLFESSCTFVLKISVVVARLLILNTSIVEDVFQFFNPGIMKCHRKNNK